MPDRWQSKTVVCKGGLVLSEEALTQGTINPGTATILQNYEPALEGGYERLLGFEKYSANVVPGEGPILGSKVALGGVFAVRSNGTTDNPLYYSTGGSWGVKLNGTARPGTIQKVRFISYSLSTSPRVAFCDGVNPAAKYDGTTYTLINGTGAPADPKYLAEHLDRLILAGYSSNPRAISISAPNDDADFDAQNGAIEIVIGDVVKGLKAFRNTLYIFCQNSIYKLIGSTDDDFAKEKVAGSLGCVSGDTIQEIGGDLVYLAPDGVRSVAATEKIGDVDLAVQSKNIRSLVIDFVGTAPEHYYSSCPVRKKSQYRMFVFDDDSDIAAKYGAATFDGPWMYGDRVDDTNSLAILGRLAMGDSGLGYEWATIVGMNAYCADSDYMTAADTDELVIFGHPANGYIYKQEIGNSFDGAAISYIYRNPQMTFDDATIRKILQKATIYTKVGGSLDASFNVLYDFENSELRQPPAIPLSQSGATPEYDSAVYGTDTFGVLTFPIFKKNLIGSGFTAAFQFSGTDTNPPHRIDSYQIEFGVAGRR